MSNPTNILEEAFKDALSKADSLDQSGVTPDGADELFAGRQPSNAELVQACADFYHQNQAVMDRAVEGALNFLSSPHGVAQVKALEGSFASTEPNPLSVELASGILGRGEFESALAGASAQPQGLRGFGVGVSVAASVIVGAFAGADIVSDFQDEAQVHTRTWVGLSFKGGLSISAGLELSFWVAKPVTGVIGGWLIDLFIPSYVVFIRFMYINQREQGTTDLIFSGVSLQFPLGLGFPIRQLAGEEPRLIAVFAGNQQAWDKSRRATLDVVNKETGVSTIAVEEVATLAVTLKNTSGNDVSLSAGAAMTLRMPSYFSEADVSGMSIAYSQWTFADDGTNLTLTLSSDFAWKAGADISFEITNVRSSDGEPPAGQQSYPGKVSLTLDDTSFSSQIAATADFDLVWENSEATLDWKTTLSDDFTLVGEGSGNVVAYAQPGDEIVTLTTATDGSGNVWVLGYVFNYNTAIPNEAIPQVYAAWWKQDSVKTDKNVFYGNKVSESGQTSISYYAGLSNSGSSIEITVTFGSPA